jgi:hypothetical protein
LECLAARVAVYASSVESRCDRVHSPQTHLMLTPNQCDEVRPHCGNCIKYGAQCPGYSKELRFVVGKHSRSQRHQQVPADNRSEVVKPKPPENKIVVAPSQLQKAQLQFEKQNCATILECPDLYLAQGLSFVIEYLLPSQSSSASHVTMTRWLSFLPTRPMMSVELNCALRCFVTHQLGAISNEQEVMQYSRSEYIRALSTLQRALRSATWNSSDTLCAAMLLGLYEVAIYINIVLQNLVYMKYAALRRNDKL